MDVQGLSFYVPKFGCIHQLLCPHHASSFTCITPTEDGVFVLKHVCYTLTYFELLMRSVPV